MPPILMTIRTTLWLIVTLLALASLSLYLHLARSRRSEHCLLRRFMLMVLGASLTGAGLLAPPALPESFELSALVTVALGLVVFAAAIVRFVLDADSPTPDHVNTQPLFPPRLRISSTPAIHIEPVMLDVSPPSIATYARATPPPSQRRPRS